MIAKPYEPDEEIARLERRLAGALTPERTEIETELRIRRAGARGEREAAYFLDFEYGHSPNHAVIHNLRLVRDGVTAQIDHLVINRFFQLQIVETKHFASSLKIEEDGSFHRYDDVSRAFVPIRSPLAQAERHGLMLERVLQGVGYHPRHFGIGPRIEPTIQTFVAINTEARIIRPSGLDTSRVMAADRFAEYQNSTMNRLYGGMRQFLVLGMVPRMLSRRAVERVARQLVALHVPRPAAAPIPVVRFGQPQLMPMKKVAGS